MKKQIAITYGDPNGVGPEILSSILEKGLLKDLSQKVNFVIYGSEEILQNKIIKRSVAGDINFQEIPNLPCPTTKPGAHSFKCLKKAIEDCLNGNSQGLVTGPISKKNWSKDGFNYKGQTELLGEMTLSQPEMLFQTNNEYPWRVLLLTRHISISEVPKALTFERFEQAKNTLNNFLQNQCKIANPKIAVAGLNPHAGEEGEIGKEEKDYWIHWCKELNIYGPFSPDDIWIRSSKAYQANQPQEFDAYLSPYHDQVLPLIKSITNFKAVNVSIGLPFIRTSPDHGTAFDLVGTGKADCEPFLEAIKLSVQVVKDNS